MTTKRVKYSGITHLELFGFRVQPFLAFDKMLQSFPDIEYLTIDGFKLEDDHFSLICQYMPKLKSLILLSGHFFNEVTVIFFACHATN